MAVTIGLLTVLFKHGRFLDFPRARPVLWLIVILLYPLLSVLPQGIVHRTFVFHRYGELFGKGWAIIIASGLVFCYAHIFLLNLVAILLTLGGGIIFAHTYMRSRSLWFSSMEHALYGDFIFTIGLGYYIYSGTAQLGRQSRMFTAKFRILRVFFPKTFSILLVAFLLIMPKTCLALLPGEILVIANRNFPQSSELARYYMEKRGIPGQNLILVGTTKDECCSREEYDKEIALPIRAYLQDLDERGLHIRCLLTIHGVPLTVSEPQLRDEEAKALEKFKNLARKLESQLKGGGNKLEDFLKNLRSQYDETQKEIAALSKADQMAAVDSELALVQKTGYPLSGWIPSPFFIGFRGKKIKDMPESALLVSRLDGPTVQIVKRVIDDSLLAEKKGLKGKAYFDARWPDPGKGDLTGYAFYDASLHKAAAIVRASKLMETILDEKESLFQPGECGDAALYCGWYSLGKYIDAFKWVPGSVGFHIASQECATLRQPGSTVWCKMMLEKGIAATVGPVGEPYVEAFPVPEVFFGLLLEGKATLVECFALSSPYLSWRMVLIGDPLYCPFRTARLELP